MVTFSIIRKSQLEGAMRLDAEYYQPEYLNYSFSLAKFPLAQLSDVCLVTDGNHSTISEQFTDSGVRYLRGKDLQDFLYQTQILSIFQKIFMRSSNALTFSKMTCWFQ